MWAMHGVRLYEVTLGVHYGLKIGCLGTNLGMVDWGTPCNDIGFCDCFGGTARI